MIGLVFLLATSHIKFSHMKQENMEQVPKNNAITFNIALLTVCIVEVYSSSFRVQVCYSTMTVWPT